MSKINNIVMAIADRASPGSAGDRKGPPVQPGLQTADSGRSRTMQVRGETGALLRRDTTFREDAIRMSHRH